MRPFAVILCCLSLASCAGIEIKPGDKSHARRDAPQGSGILTGKQGEFVLYRQAGEQSDATAGSGDRDRLSEERDTE